MRDDVTATLQAAIADPDVAATPGPARPEPKNGPALVISEFPRQSSPNLDLDTRSGVADVLTARDEATDKEKVRPRHRRDR